MPHSIEKAARPLLSSVSRQHLAAHSRGGARSRMDVEDATLRAPEERRKIWELAYMHMGMCMYMLLYDAHAAHESRVALWPWGSIATGYSCRTCSWGPSATREYCRLLQPPRLLPAVAAVGHDQLHLHPSALPANHLPLLCLLQPCQHGARRRLARDFARTAADHESDAAGSHARRSLAPLLLLLVATECRTAKRGCLRCRVAAKHPQRRR